jgi:hypothetical protein
MFVGINHQRFLRMGEIFPVINRGLQLFGLAGAFEPLFLFFVCVLLLFPLSHLS